VSVQSIRVSKDPSRTLRIVERSAGEDCICILILALLVLDPRAFLSLEALCAAAEYSRISETAKRDYVLDHSHVKNNRYVGLSEKSAAHVLS